MNDREQLQNAKRLIRARRYTEARVVLSSLDHPTAKRWLRKLEDHEKINPQRSEGLIAALIVLFVIVVAGSFYILAQTWGWF